MKERYGTVYKGSQRLIDEESGEVIEVDKLYRKQTSGNFVKAYIVQLISMLDMIGGKKLKIVNYILDNVHLSNNTMIATTREIAKATGTSLQTVITTLKILEEGNIAISNGCLRPTTETIACFVDGFAMIKEELGEDKFRFYCNDIDWDDDFDDLIFDLEIEKVL